MPTSDRQLLQRLVNFIRHDQCDTEHMRGPSAPEAPCQCCADYLQVAEHVATQAGGIPDIATRREACDACKLGVWCEEHPVLVHRRDREGAHAKPGAVKRLRVDASAKDRRESADAMPARVGEADLVALRDRMRAHGQLQIHIVGDGEETKLYRGPVTLCPHGVDLKVFSCCLICESLKCLDAGDGTCAIDHCAAKTRCTLPGKEADDYRPRRESAQP